jgi:DNA polymerase III alpha subunit (gram-positive type)
MPMRLWAILFLMAAPMAGAQEFAWPNNDPDAWLLAFVDVETTGLIPGHHEMIDIGIVMTDLDGSELGELFVRIQPEHPERTDVGARAVNAFDEDRWRELQALPPDEAINQILTFHQEIAGDRNVLMVAFNSHFDTAFLDHLFRSQDRSWRELYHYFVLDLPSMAWSLGIHGLTGSNISGKLGIEDEPHVAELHTGITGARLNARIYRALLVRAEQE